MEHMVIVTRIDEEAWYQFQYNKEAFQGSPSYEKSPGSVAIHNWLGLARANCRRVSCNYSIAHSTYCYYS